MSCLGDRRQNNRTTAVKAESITGKVLYPFIDASSCDLIYCRCKCWRDTSLAMIARHVQYGECRPTKALYIDESVYTLVFYNTL